MGLGPYHFRIFARHRLGLSLACAWKADLVVKSRLSQSGGAIIWLFIAVGLFAALGYAFTSSSRTSVSWLQAEAGKATQSGGEDCANTIDMATRRLEARGCGDMISALQDGSNIIPGAPTDGSCSIYHVAGGGVKPCQVPAIPETICNGVVSIGTACSDGSVYVGLSPASGTKMYLSPTWAPADLPYNNGNSSGWVSTGATSLTDGEANTNLLVTLDSDSVTPGFQPHRAASYCYNLNAHGKDDWYLPARNEFNVFDNQRHIIGGHIHSVGMYFYRVSNQSGLMTTSLEQCGCCGPGACFTTGAVNKNATTAFGSAVKTMCIRRD